MEATGVVAGAVILGKRSRRQLVVVVTTISIAIVNAALFIGSTRLRLVAEPSLFLLASIAIVSGVRRPGRRTSERAEGRGPRAEGRTDLVSVGAKNETSGATA